MLRQRLITAAIVLPIFLAITWFGNPWFSFMVAAFAVLGSIEFYRITILSKINHLAYFALAVVALLAISPYYPDFINKPIILTLTIIISLAWLLIIRNKDGVFNSWAWVIGGIMYIGWMLSYWSELRNLENGRELAFWSMLTIMGSDTCAYFIGRTYGKHYMATSISPKKTWEGSAGGFAGSIIASLIVGTIFALPFSYLQLILFGLCISLVAQIGDLVESLFKRNTTIKDSGTLLPGHGGVLDRIDSFIFTGFLAYYFALAFI